MVHPLYIISHIDQNCSHLDHAMVEISESNSNPIREEIDLAI